MPRAPVLMASTSAPSPTSRTSALAAADKVVIVKVNRRPTSCRSRRTTTTPGPHLQVRGDRQYQGDDLQDVLGNRAVWAVSDFTREDWADYGYDEDEDDCDSDYDDAEDEVIREGMDIEALRYVLQPRRRGQRDRDHLEDGLITTAEHEVEFAVVSDILEEHVERGVRARVRVISGNRSILG